MENKENVRGLTDPIVNMPVIREFTKNIDILVEMENTLVDKIKEANRGIKSTIDYIDTINYIKNSRNLNSLRFFDRDESCYGYKTFYNIDHKVICQMLDVFKLNCEKDLAEGKKEVEELIAKCSSKLQEATTDEQA